ncbi:hypothetical protein [Pseudoalteromonas prydzensis]|uniref:hypothetical protein n=1 Tax=Pseudoalteromonas prydzensis TaxID=182141 RepID=UPI0007E51F60|nr:hypothetical protein [Pseudoalteromonas prydzensis]MBE0379842.1 hypothetical protein [Pseudoalteromonas prydzensis ACAM 620]
MKKWIFILVALGLSLLLIATTAANTAQQSLQHTDLTLPEHHSLTDLVSSPFAGLTLESYFYHRYKKHTVLYAVDQSQHHCNVRANGEDLTVWCKKSIAAKHPLVEHSSSTSKRTEADPDDQVFEITLPKDTPPSLDLSSQQINHQTQVSLLQQVSPLIAVAFSCLLVVITVSFFHWREAKKASTYNDQKQ